MQNLPLSERIDTVDWAGYTTAYGSADAVGGLLKTLASADVDAALDASGDLWAGLCHQHAYVSMAAGPALPFLIEILQISPTVVQIEIMDMLAGFAECSEAGHPDSKLDWVKSLRAELKSHHRLIDTLQGHEDESIRCFAERIQESFKKDQQL